MCRSVRDAPDNPHVRAEVGVPLPDVVSDVILYK